MSEIARKVTWSKEHAVRETWLPSDRAGFEGITTYCGRRGRLDPKTFHVSRIGVRWTTGKPAENGGNVCRTCRRALKLG